MKFIKNWLQNRKARKEKDEFDRGYLWIMRLYFVDDHSIEEIEYEYHYRDLNDQFAKGASEGIKRINKYRDSQIINKVVPYND